MIPVRTRQTRLAGARILRITFSNFSSSFSFAPDTLTSGQSVVRVTITSETWPPPLSTKLSMQKEEITWAEVLLLSPAPSPSSPCSSSSCTISSLPSDLTLYLCPVVLQTYVIKKLWGQAWMIMKGPPDSSWGRRANFWHSMNPTQAVVQGF